MACRCPACREDGKDGRAGVCRAGLPEAPPCGGSPRSAQAAEDIRLRAFRAEYMPEVACGSFQPRQAVSAGSGSAVDR